MHSSRSTRHKKNTKFKFIHLFALLGGLLIAVVFSQDSLELRSNAAPGDKTDQTNLSYTGSAYTSEYHLYAAGLDWTKPVGMLLYTDGSGEYGLKNPDASYLLGGPSGMVAVAKKHNMILLTPLSPNKACSDGQGSCWYRGDTAGYVKWAEELVTHIQSLYPIDKKRVAVGGYSSGAEFCTYFWVPSGAAQRTMEDGVIVAISYGGAPRGSGSSFSATLKANVHMNWNGGDADPSISSVKAGHNFYTNAGFQTSLDIIPGKGHGRAGEFGPIMDAMITKHVPPATGTVPSIVPSGAPTPTIFFTTPPEPSSVNPTYFCGGSNSCVPTITSGASVPTNSAPTQNPTSVPNVSIFPTMQQQPTIQLPGNGGNNEGNNDGNNGQNNGLFMKLIALLLEFLQMILSLFK